MLQRGNGHGGSPINRLHYLIRHSVFVLDSSFEFRHSDFHRRIFSGLLLLLASGTSLPMASSLNSVALAMASSEVSIRKRLICWRMGFHWSCCGQGCSSSHLARPTTQR